MNREIDALVAEKVMGLVPIWGVDLGTQPLFDASEEMNSKGCLRPAKSYSTDIAAAWEVVEKVNLFDSWAMWQPNTDGSYEIFGAIRGAEFVIVRAETAPMAICLAALKAKGVEVAALGDE